MKPGVRPDQELWNDFIAGSREAFRLLYERYADALHAFGLKYTPDRELLKDCIHDLFVDLHTYRKTLAPEVNVRFYLLRSFRRKMNAAFQKASAEAAPSSHAEFLLSAADTVLFPDDPEEETLRSVFREINQLPSRQKEALYLKFHQGLNYEEVAVLMKVPVATCRTLVYRGIKQLKKNLQDQPGYQVLWLLVRGKSGDTFRG